MEITHEDFIKKLKDVGFDISVKYDGDSANSHCSLYVNGIKIDNIDYILFGYYCGGQYVPCCRTNKELFNDEDFEKALKICSKTLMNELEYIKKIPTYFDCKDFLTKKFGKTKVETEAIKRVLDLLKNNYQELRRFVALNKTI